jgi:hypothetical protein
MGAPLGNKNGAKGKRFEEALRRALARSGGSVDAGLNPVADMLLKAALEGESWAILAIRDTLDGKPAQAVTLGGDGENPLFIEAIERRVVDPKSNGQ